MAQCVSMYVTQCISLFQSAYGTEDTLLVHLEKAVRSLCTFPLNCLFSLLKWIYFTEIFFLSYIHGIDAEQIRSNHTDFSYTYLIIALLPIKLPLT